MGRARELVLFALLVTGLVWAGALAYWALTDRDVSGQDILVCLLLLPVVMIGGYFLLRWGIERARARGGAAASEVSAAAAAPAPPSVDETERRLTFEVLAASLRVPPGSSPSAVWQALGAGNAPASMPSCATTTARRCSPPCRGRRRGNDGGNVRRSAGAARSAASRMARRAAARGHPACRGAAGASADAVAHGAGSVRRASGTAAGAHRARLAPARDTRLAPAPCGGRPPAPWAGASAAPPARKCASRVFAACACRRLSPATGSCPAI